MKALLFAATVLFSTQAFAEGELIALDSGHTKEFPGSFGACGAKEAWVNQQVSVLVARGLQRQGFKVRFTRSLIDKESDLAGEPGTEPGSSLTARGASASAMNAALMISIHHDSLPEDGIEQDETLCRAHVNPDKRVATAEFKAKFQIGYNTFADDRSPVLQNSIRLATAIAEQIQAAGQTPANFHTPEVEPKGCGSCKFVDEAKGVMTRRLGALSRATMPAVLVEVTNLRVPEMERNAKDPAYQQMIADAIVAGVLKYFGRL